MENPKTIKTSKDNAIYKNMKIKNDIILIGIIIIAALICFAAYYIFYRNEGTYAQISVDSKIYKTLPLNKDTTITIRGANNSINVLKIKDGYASITEADCPDMLCVKQKKIHYNGETLVCLPHKVVVAIISNETADIDGVAY